MSRNYPRYSASTVITSNINSKPFLKDPALAAIADMVDEGPRGASLGHGGRNGHQGNDIQGNHGDIMKDAVAFYSEKSSEKSNIIQDLDLQISKKY